MKKIKIFILSVMLFGCSVRESFVYHENNERYGKDGFDKLETVKAMLECGSIDPFGYLKIQSDESYQKSLERLAAVEQCMINDGFTINPGFIEACKGYSKWLACKPENADLIPKRDVKRRLESLYCKRFSKAQACKP